MLRSSRCSRASASVIATPSRPARPVRPMRCTYASGEDGTSKFTTCDTCSMSRPRAATSVATSTSDDALAEAAHHAVALLLREPAVQRLGVVAARVERLGQLVDFGARAAEHDRRRRRLHVEHARERRDLVPPLHDVHRLAHARRLARGASSRSRSSRAPDRAGGASRSPRCAAAASRRTARSGASSGTALENRLEIFREAHVEHLVGLVEHDRRHARRVAASRGG